MNPLKQEDEVVELVEESRRGEESWVLDGSVDFKGSIVKRVDLGAWKASFFIIGSELSERFSYYGIASNLITYMTSVLHQSLPSAAKEINNWVGVTLILPFVGAFLADAYFGKFWIIFFVSVLYVLGLIFLTLSVSIRSLKPPPCNTNNVCPKASLNQMAFFMFSLYLISIGTGGIKPCLEAFGADQFDEEDAQEKKMKSSFFNWWYCGINTGAMLAFTILVYVQDNVNWGLGFGIPTITMSFAFVVFFTGTKYYRHKLPSGSLITRMAKVMVAAFRKRNLQLPNNADMLHAGNNEEFVRVGRQKLVHTNRLRFLDKAAIMVHSQTTDVTSVSSWNLCTITQIEETKLMFHILPIWFLMLPYGIVMAQVATLFTKQGSTMDRKIGPNFEIPAASLQAMGSISIIIILPLYDLVLVPIVRRFTGHQRGITLLQRMGIGLFLSILCMGVAALTEMHRLNVVKKYDDENNTNILNQTIPMSIFWLLPQYILVGVSDVFGIVGQQEFFYDQAPDTSRSFGMAMYLSSVGVGNFLSSLLITIIETITNKGTHSWFANNINKGHLDYFYWLLCGMSFINMVVYIMVTHTYKYKEVHCVMKDSSPNNFLEENAHT